ncbi:MAG: ABC transporter ATP-binding protein [Candidatus Aminicenantes bacterium]|jgi:ABC-2 type transport system ATP-binding protein
MLELKGITKKYHFFPALNDVSFTAKSTEILGYLGPNGAGKTTTIKILAGLLTPTEGQVIYKGQNIEKDLYGYKKNIGYVPEQSDIYPHMTAYEYLLLVGRLRHIKEKLLKDKIVAFMELLDLDDDMDSMISSYSKGMIQKVLIVSALLHNPEILLLDEPLSGLDVTTSLIIKELLKKLARDGKIIIYSSHILEVVEKVCSRVVIVHKGNMVADDSVSNLCELMKLPTLEEIFSQLVVLADTDKTSDRMIEVMKFAA